MANADRLRPAPQDRFAESAQLLDLVAATARLRAEAHPAIDGHRQVALGRHGDVTLVLFAFDGGGFHELHTVPGVVTLHTLRGHMKVRTEGDGEHDVPAGRLLTLAPNVPHSVHAVQPGEMLMTVHLMKEEEGAGPDPGSSVAG
ncbi:MAG TPA: AraC family ligand binding domain-containing protein [Gemmatimonadales bacterium]|nr:AraC family ligand binding domain-containing protein [Gemmatimonadales bacterium]